MAIRRNNLNFIKYLDKQFQLYETDCIYECTSLAHMATDCRYFHIVKYIIDRFWLVSKNRNHEDVIYPYIKSIDFWDSRYTTYFEKIIDDNKIDILEIMHSAFDYGNTKSISHIATRYNLDVAKVRHEYYVEE